MLHHVEQDLPLLGVLDPESQCGCLLADNVGTGDVELVACRRVDLHDPEIHDAVTIVAHRFQDDLGVQLGIECGTQDLAFGFRLQPGLHQLIDVPPTRDDPGRLTSALVDDRPGRHRDEPAPSVGGAYPQHDTGTVLSRQYPRPQGRDDRPTRHIQEVHGVLAHQIPRRPPSHCADALGHPDDPALQVDAEHHIGGVGGHHGIATFEAGLRLGDLLVGEMVQRAVHGLDAVFTHHLPRDLLRPHRAAVGTRPSERRMPGHPRFRIERTEHDLPVARVDQAQPQGGVGHELVRAVTGESPDGSRDVLEAQFGRDLQHEQHVE